MIHDDELEIMENIYSSNKRSHALIVYGEKGLGKRSCIQYFLQKKNNIIKIINYLLIYLFTISSSSKAVRISTPSFVIAIVCS